MIINDWKSETRSPIRALRKAGVVIVRGDNSDDVFQADRHLISNLAACDEAWLYVHVNGENHSLYLAFGNEPGTLVSDYTCDPVLDKVIDAHYAKWNGRKQPVTTTEKAYGN